MSKITTIRDDVKGQRENFTYDPLDRLVSAVPSPMTGVTTTLDYTETYSYTPIGNFISKNGVTQYYTSTKPHAVTSLSNGASFTYDANGNMTQRIEGGVVYTQVWNVDNRLVQVDCTTQPTWFYYGPDGDMVRKDNPRDTTLYVSADSEVFHGTPTSTNITLYYTFNGTRVAIRRDADVYWLHGDHLGSASVATSITGAVVSEVRYLPFGETHWFTGTAPTNRLYTGQRSLMGVGLYDYNARMYSPSLGRFISADTLVPVADDPQAYNRYAYTRNSPMRYIDPDGHYWWDAIVNTGFIKSSSAGNKLPALAVAATIDVQSNGMWLDRLSAGYTLAGGHGINNSLGPGQVTPAEATTVLGREVSTIELLQNAQTSIEARARTLAQKDAEFLSACGSSCSKQMMTQDRWLVFALAGNGQGVEPVKLWESDRRSFNWNKYFSGTDAKTPTDILTLLEQGDRSRDRYLLSQFAAALEALSSHGILGLGLFGAPEHLDQTINFLHCMSANGAKVEGCR